MTFQQMIVLAEHPDGIVDMTPAAIAARTSIPLEIIQRGISVLEQPDTESRTPDEEGRRIIRLAEGRTWGWRITNWAHYNAIRTAEERREYMRLYQQARRAAKKDAKTSVNTASTDVNNVNPLAVAVSVAIPVDTSSSTTARERFLSQVQRRFAWDAECKALLAGVRGPAPTPDQLDAAFLDMEANGVDPKTAKLPVLRAFVQGILRGERVPAAGGKRQTNVEKTLAALDSIPVRP